MQHPEEGIIHAWIDGALSSSESAELASHVAGCAECGARVAQARGLVAAASRIVGHLDAVPANVVPIKPALAKSWSRSAWPAAIAATLVLGISLYSRKGQPGLRDAATKAVPDSARLAPISRPVAPAASVPAPTTIQPSPRKATADQGPVAQNRASVGGRPDVAGDLRALKVANTPPPSAPAPGSPQTSALSASVPSVVATSVAEARAERALPVPSSVAVGGTAGGAGAAARMQRAAPQRARDEVEVAQRVRGDGDGDAVASFAGCYDMSASTDILPARFALVPDTAPGMPGLHGVRYLDGSGRPSDHLADAGWAIEGGRAVIKTLGRGSILTLARTGSEVVGDSPNGPRTGRVASCR